MLVAQVCERGHPSSRGREHRQRPEQKARAVAPAGAAPPSEPPGGRPLSTARGPRPATVPRAQNDTTDGPAEAARRGMRPCRGSLNIPNQEATGPARRGAARPPTASLQMQSSLVTLAWPWLRASGRLKISPIVSLVRVRSFTPARHGHGTRPVLGIAASARLGYVVREAASRGGIQKLAPHDLRRTCARLCHQAGGDLDQVQFLLRARVDPDN